MTDEKSLSEFIAHQLLNKSPDPTNELRVFYEGAHWALTSYRFEFMERMEADNRATTEAEGDAFTHGYFCAEKEATTPLRARIAEQAMQLVSAQAQAQENHERAERLEKNASAEIQRQRTENAHLEAALAEASKDAERLNAAMNPFRWSRDMNDAWCQHIPNLQNAFDALKNAAMKGQP